MTKTVFCVPSSDQIHTLAGVVYLPQGETKGFFHIVHGMAEHIGRYDKLMSELSQAGYICFGYDHLGHGNTVKEKSELGYIAKKDGYDLMAQDVKLFSDAVMQEYQSAEKELPYYLMGHSMGSFVTRWAITKYVSPSKYICMGTGGKNSAAGIGLALIAVMKLFRGGHHISSLVHYLTFGSYNKRFGKASREDPYLWLTCDEAERNKYYADDHCAFPFTLSAMGDLVRLNRITNTKKWYAAMPKNLPILLVAGENDPVGNYGKGIREVCDKLQKQGINAKAILYPDVRHEILNDSTYSQVKADILAFLQE